MMDDGRHRRGSWLYAPLGWAFFLTLAAALLGSMINIPVARLPAEVRQESTTVTVFGVTYRVPVAVQSGSTTIAVNVGAPSSPQRSRST